MRCAAYAFFAVIALAASWATAFGQAKIPTADGAKDYGLSIDALVVDPSKDAALSAERFNAGTADCRLWHSWSFGDNG